MRKSFLTGMVERHTRQSSCVSGMSWLQTGQGAKGSISSILSGLRTIFSILRLYAVEIEFLHEKDTILSIGAIVEIYKILHVLKKCKYYLNSGRINIVAYSKPVFLKPDRWHSITVEIRMGVTCAGNLLMCLATRISMRALALHNIK